MPPVSSDFNSYVPYLQGATTGLNSYTTASDIWNAGSARSAAYSYNAGVAEQYAALAPLTSAGNAQQAGTMGNIQTGQLGAHIVSQGVQLNSGTPAVMLDANALQQGLNVQKQLYQGQLQQAQYQNMANMDTYSSQMAQYSSDQMGRQTLLTGLQRGLSQMNNPVPSSGLESFGSSMYSI